MRLRTAYPRIHETLCWLFIFKVTEPSSIPYRTHPACAKRATYPDPPPVIPVPDTAPKLVFGPVGMPNFEMPNLDSVNHCTSDFLTECVRLELASHSWGEAHLLRQIGAHIFDRCLTRPSVLIRCVCALLHILQQRRQDTIERVDRDSAFRNSAFQSRFVLRG